MTAEAFMTELARDAQYLERIEKEDQRLAQEEARLSQDERPIVADLVALGLHVASIWDLVNSESDYSLAVPSLLRHLNFPYVKKNKEGIIRSLAAPFARGVAGRQLIRLFRAERDDDLRWVMGNTLSVVADAGDVEDIISLLEDRRYGFSRSELPFGVTRILKEDSIPYLIRLLENDDLLVSAIACLGKLKAQTSADKISEFVEHPESEVRKTAKKALKYLGI